MSIILGINAFHAGASACLLIDGNIQFAIAEERLNRRKYYAGFPELAIRECLKWSGITIKDIDYVGIGRNPKANLDSKIHYALKNPLLLKNLLRIKSARQGLGDLKTLFARYFPEDELRFTQINVEHHLAHTASAFYCSGWDYAAGITIDGSGDFLTCMMSDCEGNEIKPVHRIFVPNSLGSFYTTVCQFIGYTKYGDEGKVMGLAPLGTDKYSDIFDKMIEFNDGNIRLNPRYFLPFGNDQGFEIDDDGEMISHRQFSDEFISYFGLPRQKNGEITQRDKDLAFGLQKRFEEIYFELLNFLYLKVPRDRVVIAGGCALNSVANGKISQFTPFISSFIQPAAGDDGLAIGSALYIAHKILNEPKQYLSPSAYLGGEYSDDRIERALASKNLIFCQLRVAELLDATVSELMSGNVVGWFQGRSEWGPRALGNRSIICHPGYPNMKETLNARIKYREEFRPFAPVVLAERQVDIFSKNTPTPFMMHVYDIKPQWRGKLSAVTHVDGTGRVQTLSKSDNPLFYELISRFEKASGIPVVLNTSFNENEPIVECPEEAVDCFVRTKMDVLVIGGFICKKIDNC